MSVAVVIGWCSSWSSETSGSGCLTQLIGCGKDGPKIYTVGCSDAGIFNRDR